MRDSSTGSRETATPSTLTTHRCGSDSKAVKNDNADDDDQVLVDSIATKLENLGVVIIFFSINLRIIASPIVIAGWTRIVRWTRISAAENSPLRFLPQSRFFDEDLRRLPQEGILQQGLSVEGLGSEWNRSATQDLVPYRMRRRGCQLASG